MNPKEELILGFAHKVKPNKKSKLEPENFPSKIGGQAIWLIPQDVPVPSCEQCKAPLKFLLQVYAPLDYEHAYHRYLYVFYCENVKCNRTRECLKIYRSQLPKANPYFTASENPKLTEKYTESQAKLQASTSSLTPEYLIKTQILAKEEAEEQLFLCEEHVKERLRLPTDPAYEEYEAELVKGENLKHEKELLDQFNQKGDSGDHEDLEGYLPEEKVDKEYEKYKYLLDLNGNSEILRYVRSRESFPLWYSEANQWKPGDAGKCGSCGSNRIFEFQINSTFLNLYKELIYFDWGIIAFYTCEKSCVSKGDYIEEKAFVQFSSEELKLEGERLNELQVIHEEKEIIVKENEEGVEGEGGKKAARKKKPKKAEKVEKTEGAKEEEEEKKVAEQDSEEDWE